ISGNTFGVTVGGANNRVQGNYIGTDRTGTRPLGNSSVGARVGGSDNVIGGTVAGARNVISGNGEGVSGEFGVSGDGVNKVLGNFIGTDFTGTAPLGNSDAGVDLDGKSNFIIGGIGAGARNVISGNGKFGIFING